MEKRSEAVNYQFKRNEAPVVDPKTGEIFGYIILSDSAAEKINYSGNNTYTYIGIPLSISYQLIKFKKMGLGVQMNSSYLKQTALQGTTINPATLKLENLTNSNSEQLRNIFNAGIGLNLSYAITPRLAINIHGYYRKQISKNEKTTAPKQISLNLGLHYLLF